MKVNEKKISTKEYSRVKLKIQAIQAGFTDAPSRFSSGSPIQADPGLMEILARTVLYENEKSTHNQRRVAYNRTDSTMTVSHMNKMESGFLSRLQKCYYGYTDKRN